eukprot:scaffold23201_cov65-Phaeocystis_antarctica.AAC.7
MAVAVLKVSPVLGVSEMYISCSAGGAQRIGMERGVVSGRAWGQSLNPNHRVHIGSGKDRVQSVCAAYDRAGRRRVGVVLCGPA